MYILLTATMPNSNNGWRSNSKVFRNPDRTLCHFPGAATMSRSLAIEYILAIMRDQKMLGISTRDPKVHYSTPDADSINFTRDAANLISLN
jgi:hypothetical protein